MTGNLTRNRTKAVIWDGDRVIADTDPYHLRVWQHVFHKREVDFTADDFRHSFGQRNDTTIRNALGEGIPQDETDAIAQGKERAFRRLVQQNLKPLPGAIELMASLLVIRRPGIDSSFQAMVSSQEVIEGKRSPQGFPLAARKLGVPSKDYVVIEDSVAGFTACKSTEVHCLAVTNTLPRESLAQADLVIDSLEEVTAIDLEALFDTDR
jgi:HAD superfamily hydrolase (TIGR01509 family)